MKLRLLQLLAIVSPALYLVPTGAHLFELVNKMTLPLSEYMTVQKIYAGWSLFGIIIGIALLATLLHTVLVRSDRRALALSFGAFVALAASQVLFWMFTYPVNAASRWFFSAKARAARTETDDESSPPLRRLPIGWMLRI